MDAARKVYAEFTGFRSGSPDRVWRSFRHGDTAEFFLVDVRAERIPGQRIMSKAQLDWLKQGLSQSTAVFKFILTPQPITAWPGAQPGTWERFPAQRDELLGHILNLRNAGKTGFWFLAGDVHSGSLGWVGNGPAGRVREICMGPGGTIQSGGVLSGAFAEIGRQFEFCTGRNNHCFVRANPDPTGPGGVLTVEVRTVVPHVSGNRDTTTIERSYLATFRPDGTLLTRTVSKPDKSRT